MSKWVKSTSTDFWSLDIESRELDILNYVKEHPNCPKADVIRHMKGKSAVTTTHSILKDLIREGKLNVYKKNIQTHLLTINEDNQFNQIIDKLLQIQILIEALKNIDSLIKQRLQNSLNNTIKEYYVLAKLTFFQDLNILLYSLLNYTYRVIKSEKDRRIIYEKNSALNAWLYLITGAESINMLSRSLDAKAREFHDIMNKRKNKKSKLFNDEDFELNEVLIDFFIKISEYKNEALEVE